jgi:hypothetical protein
MPVARAPGRTDRAARDDAEAIALRAVQFLAEEPDRLQRFLDLTGVPPDSLRARLAEPAFLAGILDHLLGDEPQLLVFAEWAQVPPADIASARRTLGGGEAGAD